MKLREDGGAEIDANEAFAQVVQAIDDVFAKCRAEVEEAEYVAASCFWHSLIGIDENGEPTTPVFTWAETRPADFVQKLRDELDEKEIHNRTGCAFSFELLDGETFVASRTSEKKFLIKPQNGFRFPIMSR